MSEEIKSCPFCGDEAMLLHVDCVEGEAVDFYSIQCANESCGVQPDSVEMGNKDEIIEAWNTRINDH
jgi:Lar family restriction alleviation protein